MRRSLEQRIFRLEARRSAAGAKKAHALRGRIRATRLLVEEARVLMGQADRLLAAAEFDDGRCAGMPEKRCGGFLWTAPLE
jgi:hypothetical protein